MSATAVEILYTQKFNVQYNSNLIQVRLVTNALENAWIKMREFLIDCSFH